MNISHPIGPQIFPISLSKLGHNINCSCTIFLAQILLIRPWPKAQPTINICRGWVKELSLSEPIWSDTWTALLQKTKAQEWISHV